MSDKKSSYFSNERSELLKHFPGNKGPILDIGCASGGFGVQLKQAFGGDLEVWGVEPFEHAANEARLHLDNVFHGSVEEVISKLPNAYFSCIVFNDSLEHMVDPYGVLKLVREKLVPSTGFIFSSIPNVRYYMVLYELLFRKSWEYKEEGVLDRTHLRFFTEKSMRQMFVDAGYKVESTSGIRVVKREHRKVVKWLGRLFPSLFDDIAYLQFVFVVRQV